MGTMFQNKSKTVLCQAKRFFYGQERSDFLHSFAEQMLTLSIDSDIIGVEGEEDVPQKMSKKNIEDFLLEMKKILTNEQFDIDKQFQFIQQREKDEPNDECTNQNTLIELEYDRFDVVDELKTLRKFQNYTGKKIADYMHEESAYTQTSDKMIIPFSLAKEIRPF